MATQKGFDRHQRDLVGHETGQQQNRVTIAVRRGHQQRPGEGQQRYLGQGADLHQRMQSVRRTAVGVSCGHRQSLLSGRNSDRSIVARCGALLKGEASRSLARPAADQRWGGHADLQIKQAGQAPLSMAIRPWSSA